MFAETDRAIPGRFLVIACTLTALFLLGACGGGGGDASSGPPQRISQVTSTRDQIDGGPGTSSTVMLTLARGIELPNDEVPLESAFEVQVPDPLEEGVTHRVFPALATQSEDDHRIFELSFDVIIPDGSELLVAGRLLGGDESQSLTAGIQGDVNAIQALLASVALAPTDVAVLEAGEFAPATADDRDRAVQRVALEQHLDARGSPAELTDLALQRFDAMPEDVIPSPKLRAALSALTGTFADAAIEDLLTENNCSAMPVRLLAFQDPPDAPDLFARVTHEGDGGRIISFSPRLEGEPLELLAAIMAHEAVHCDVEGSIDEETAATAFDTLLYIQFLTVNPDLAFHGSPLSKDLNVDAIAMINSGRAAPESIGILASPGVRFAVPNTNAQAGSFEELIASAYAGAPRSSPVEPLADIYLQGFAEMLGAPAGSPFDFEYLDAVFGAVLDPEVLIAAISALRLEPEG